MQTRIGRANTAYYLYIGPGDVSIDPLPNGARLHMGDRKFWFAHTETVEVAGTPVYRWAILRALTEEE